MLLHHMAIQMCRRVRHICAMSCYDKLSQSFACVWQLVLLMVCLNIMQHLAADNSFIFTLFIYGNLPFQG